MDRAQLQNQLDRARAEAGNLMSDHRPNGMAESHFAEAYRRIKNSGDSTKVSAALADAKRATQIRLASERALKAAEAKVKALESQIASASA